MKTVPGYNVLMATPEQRTSLSKFIAPRRGAIASFPGLSVASCVEVADELFATFGLTKYVGCVTAEPMKRPIPHVFPVAEVAKLTSLYEKWAPSIFDRIISEITAPIQTFNKTSRLGWDSFEVMDNKLDRLDPVIAKAMQSDEVVAEYAPAFIIMNVRLQAEDANKEREFLFVNPQGDIYSQVLGRKQREVEVKDVGVRICSRVRGVYNLPLLNLVKQILDTAIHNVFLSYPAFHHDLFNNRTLPVRGEHMCVDVKHFERHTAVLVRKRAELLGGLYARIGDAFSRIPYCCPTDDRKSYAFLYPDRERGFSEQFASGDSAVAPAQKEVFLALYAEYFVQSRGMDTRAAMNMVMQGGDERLTIRNYGDDQSLSGDPGELRDVYQFLGQYLHVEIEDPPKFLGLGYVNGRWELSVESYLSKSYLNERRPFSNFRKYPFLGLVLKRAVFIKSGDPKLVTDVFPLEDRLLEQHGLPWSQILREAEIERVQAATASSAYADPNWVLGKDYLMTPEEKIKSGEFFGLMPARTAPIIRRLLGGEWQKRIKRTL
jgi:hypothetical protein